MSWLSRHNRKEESHASALRAPVTAGKAWRGRTVWIFQSRNWNNDEPSEISTAPMLQAHSNGSYVQF